MSFQLALDKYHLTDTAKMMLLNKCCLTHLQLLCLSAVMPQSSLHTCLTVFTTLIHHLSILPGRTGAVKVLHMTSVANSLW